MTNAPTQDKEALAKAAAGFVTMSVADGTLGAVDQEDMLEMADAMNAAPHVVAGFVMHRDLAGKGDGTIDGLRLRDRAMGMYYDEQFTDMMMAMGDELAAREAADESRHADSVIAYNRMTPADVDSAAAAAAMGDDSYLIRAEEHYYLG